MCDIAELYHYRVTSPEALKAEFEDALPFRQTEDDIPIPPLTGVGAESRVRLTAHATVGPDAP